MELAPWQFWIQIAALLFACGVAWRELRFLSSAVSELTHMVRADHDELVEMRGQMTNMVGFTSNAHTELKRRVEILERRVFNGTPNK